MYNTTVFGDIVQACNNNASYANEMYEYAKQQRQAAKLDRNLDDYAAWNEEVRNWAKVYFANIAKSNAAFHLWKNLQAMRGNPGYRATNMKGA